MPQKPVYRVRTCPSFLLSRGLGLGRWEGANLLTLHRHLLMYFKHLGGVTTEQVSPQESWVNSPQPEQPLGELWLILAEKPCHSQAATSNTLAATPFQTTKHTPQVNLPSRVTPGFCTLSSWMSHLNWKRPEKENEKTRRVRTQRLLIQKEGYRGRWRMRRMKDGTKKWEMYRWKGREYGVGCRCYCI